MIALDLFAGTGWGVACQALGIEEYGVEIMPEAIATRELNGMTTIYNDVWEGLEAPVDRVRTNQGNPRDGYYERPIDAPSPTVTGIGSRSWNRIKGEAPVPDYDLLIASPPCQTFSMAGGGAGRKALDDVLGLIDEKAYRSVEGLRAFGESHDPRTALVLTPLAHVYRDLPRYVVFEQVPPVLPVWERCAEEMRAWGYSVWTGNLQAEMYGVPQTRKRAILIAKRDPELDGEAAPPTPTHSRYYSRDPKRLDPGVLPWVSMAEALGWGRTARPSVTVTGGGTETGGAEPLAKLAREVAAADWVAKEGARYFHPMSYGRRGIWPGDEPAPTIRSVQRDMPPTYTPHPRDAVVMRSNYGTGGDASLRGERAADEPSATMTSKADHNRWESRPATTVQGDPRIAAPGHHERQMNNAERVTVAEAAALQSYPPGFTFAGTKTKQFLQVGNAVPPLLAEAILRAVIS